MSDSPKEGRGNGVDAVTPDSYAAEPVKYGSLQVVDVAAEAAAVSEAYRNLVICRVNRSCLRLAVFEDVFRWHSHPASDELFLVVEGLLTIDLADHLVRGLVAAVLDVVDEDVELHRLP